MENCKMSGKSRGILKWMISGNPASASWNSLLFEHDCRKIHVQGRANVVNLAVVTGSGEHVWYSF